MADQRDLVLSPVQYAFVQDGSNTGNVRVLVGPLVDTLTQNDRLVIWNGTKFYEPPDTAQALQTFTTATENQYVVLENPATGEHESHPDKGRSVAAADLDFGKKINVPGPTTFALWPGQRTRVIDGHRLSNDEYLVIQCYDPKAANASEAIQAPADLTEDEPQAQRQQDTTPWVIGERRVIKGTQVSFYIPPTGVEVLQEEATDKAKGDRGPYVRQAAVVRRMEYVCLENEKGRERYEEGPAVVFPEPDETWVTERGEIKYRKLDLSAQSGLYIKVTEDYQHDGPRPIQAWRGTEMVEVAPGKELKEGDELFVTGADTPLYLPRVEHFVIEYGENKKKHHAIALPAGKGRYVLDRVGDGGVSKVIGPMMYLPDPRTEVVVRRVLDQKTVTLWYPGNPEAAAVNEALATAQAQRGEQYLASEPVAFAMNVSGQPGSLARSSAAVTGGMPAGRIKRGTEYTPTRTITLEDKYEGPPQISVWPGYAVMVMDPTGNRRVEVGPKDLLLEYHETLMALTLSTGRPKGSGPPVHMVYLRTLNNAVGDRVTVETRDLVPVALEYSLRVDFEGETPEERNQWFYIEDYVALLTDHVRSRLRNLAKRHDVQEFYADTIDLIRDDLLGMSEGEEGRTGHVFPENGMRLYDIEVLNVTIQHPSVREMLDAATAASLRGAIEVSQAEEATRREATLERLKRDRITSREETAEVEAEAAVHGIERDVVKSLRAIDGSKQEATAEADAAAIAREQVKLDADQDIALQRERDEQVLARATREVELFVQQAQAIEPKLAEAIITYGQQRIAAEIAESIGGYAVAIGGGSVVDILQRHLGGTTFGPALEALARRPLAEVQTNGGDRTDRP